MRLMFHDDSCGELLDASGKCPKCKFSPDTQSLGLKEVSVTKVKEGLATGKTFTSSHRVSVVGEVAGLVMSDLQKAKQIVAQAQEAFRTIHVEALREIVGRNQNDSTRVDRSIDEQDWLDLRDLAKAIGDAQFRADMFRRRADDGT